MQIDSKDRGGDELPNVSRMGWVPDDGCDLAIDLVSPLDQFGEVSQIGHLSSSWLNQESSVSIACFVACIIFPIGNPANGKDKR